MNARFSSVMHGNMELNSMSPLEIQSEYAFPGKRNQIIWHVL